LFDLSSVSRSFELAPNEPADIPALPTPALQPMQLAMRMATRFIMQQMPLLPALLALLCGSDSGALSDLTFSHSPLSLALIDLLSQLFLLSDIDLSDPHALVAPLTEQHPLHAHQDDAMRHEGGWRRDFANTIRRSQPKPKPIVDDSMSDQIQKQWDGAGIEMAATLIQHEQWERVIRFRAQF